MQLFAISFVRFYRAIAADAMYTYFQGEPELSQLCHDTAPSEKFCEKEFFAAGSEVIQEAFLPEKSLDEVAWIVKTEI